MNLPFGLPAIKDTMMKKREDTSELTSLYEKKLHEYRDILENYKYYILEYSRKLDSYDKRVMDGQLSAVQSALDITYLKEQTEKTDKSVSFLKEYTEKTDHAVEILKEQTNKAIELLEETKNGPISSTLSNLESLITAVVDISDKLEGFDKNVVNRLSELILELQKQSLNLNKQYQSELAADIELLNSRVKRNNVLLWFLFIFNLLSLGALGFIVYVMENIPS